MKRILKTLITLTALTVLFGCAREENYNPVLPEDVIHATFQLKTGGIATKAFSDGLSADGLLVGLYNKQGEGDNATLTYLQDLSVTDLTKIPVSGKAATFETNLVRGQNYVLVFWAQKKTSAAYTLDFATQTLTVSTTGDANDESRDAFYKVFETGTISETNFQFSGIELTRPFAQINVLAPNEDVTAAALSKVIFTKSAMTVSKAPKTMNLLTGKVGDFTATYTMDAAAITEPVFGSFAETHTYIAMNYVLGDDAKKLYDIDLDVYSTVNGEEQSPIHFDVDNAPAQRNYRTNIIGNVFTLDTQFNIIINPIYNEPSYEEGLPGVEFEPVTITPTLPDTTPDGVTVTPSATEGAPATINFAPNAGPLTLSAAATSEAALHARTSNAAVATASVDGSNVTITPVTPGEAIITIYTDPVMATKAIDETKNYAAGKLEYKVVVEAPAEKLDVTIAINDVNLKVGEGFELEPEVNPEELYTQIVATPAEGYATYFDWDADNWIIEAKKVTPAEGIAITLSYPGDDTYKEASKTIKVYISEKPVPEVLFENITVTVDQEDNLTYVVDESLEASVTFDEGEQEIYDVYKLGEVWKIKGLKRGTAELTLKVAETATTAPTSVTVTVTSNGKTPTFVTEDLIEINVDGVKQLTKEEDYDLDSDGTVTFSIAEEYATIITCTSAGQIKGLAEGTAKVKINVAASDTFEAGSTELNVKVNPAPVVEPATATITITGVPTEAQEAGATFDVTITTNSTAALVVSATTGATVAPKTGAENVYTVTCADNLEADTEVTLTASVAAVENAFTAAEESKTFTVKAVEVPPTPTSEYVKITSTADVTDGDYLIVYEGESAVAFNGAISDKLDIANNGISVTIADNKISGTEIIDASIFVFEVVEGGFAIKSASGIYISGKSGNNVIVEGSDPVANTVSISDGNAVIASNAASIMYNSSSGQERFRFYKDGSAQKAVALYKKVGSGTGAVPTEKEEPTLTIGGTIPTAAMAKDETFDFTVTTNSTGAITVALAPEGAASVAAKSGAEKTWTVTAGEPNSETTVTLTVSVAATDSYKAKSETATFKVAKKAGTVTTYTTVTELVALADNSTFTDAEGLVVAKSQRGVIVTDGTNNVLLYNWANNASSLANLAIGDKVTFDGTKKSYNGVPEIDPISNVVVASSNNTVTYPDAKDITATFDAYTASVAEYITFTGTLAVSGSYINVNVEGATSNQGSVSYPIDKTNLTDGNNVKLTGYYNGKSSSKYINIIVTNVEVLGSTPKFSVDKSEFSVGASATSVTVNITANVAWTVTPGAGVTADKTSGSENAAVKLSFAANTVTTAQTYTATIAATGFDPVTVTINQAAYVESSGQEKSVEFTTTAGGMTGTNAAISGQLDDVSIAISTGTIADEIRIFKNQTVTVSVPDGMTITSIVFTCTANGTAKYGPGCLTGEGYTAGSAKTGEWSGSAQSVTLTASSDQVRATSIVVTYN